MWAKRQSSIICEAIRTPKTVIENVGSLVCRWVSSLSDCKKLTTNLSSYSGVTANTTEEKKRKSGTWEVVPPLNIMFHTFSIHINVNVVLNRIQCVGRIYPLAYIHGPMPSMKTLCRHGCAARKKVGWCNRWKSGSYDFFWKSVF
jgi:hypothetical protein